jgi:hypothetical protein
MWEKSSKEMKLTSHLCKMVNVWSYTSISPYSFMACVLLKHVLYIYVYGCVSNEHRDSFIFSRNTVWLFFYVECPLYFLHLQLTNFCLFGLVMINFICIIFCHLHKAVLFYLSSFMLHSSKNVTWYVVCGLQKFTIWVDKRLLSELLHKIYLYHQRLCFCWYCYLEI